MHGIVCGAFAVGNLCVPAGASKRELFTHGRCAKRRAVGCNYFVNYFTKCSTCCGVPESVYKLAFHLGESSKLIPVLIKMQHRRLSGLHKVSRIEIVPLDLFQNCLNRPINHFNPTKTLELKTWLVNWRVNF